MPAMQLTGYGCVHWRRSPLLRTLQLLVAYGLVAHAKFQTGVLRMGGAKDKDLWQYVSKFGFDIGSGKFKMRVQTLESQHADLRLDFFLDEDWASVESMENVCERKTYSKGTQQIGVPGNGAWSAWTTQSLTQTIRPHIWLMAVSDCDRSLGNERHRLRYEFRAVQADESELSYELKWMFTVHSLALCALAVFSYMFLRRCGTFRKSAGSLHPVICVLAIAVVLQCLAQLCHTSHLWRYGVNGSGLRALEAISEFLSMMNQLLLGFLLIIIGHGYTLTQSGVGDFDLMIPVGIVVTLLHLVLVAVGKTVDDSAYKFHEYEGVHGWILVFFRVLLWMWFIFAVRNTASVAGTRQQAFLRKYLVAGSIYFLSVPLIFLIVRVFAAYLQHLVMQMGLLVMQLTSDIWLANLFLLRGDYFKASTLNDSLLPGGNMESPRTQEEKSRQERGKFRGYGMHTD